MLQLMNGTLKV